MVGVVNGHDRINYRVPNNVISHGPWALPPEQTTLLPHLFPL
jgi:hypothetical protein